MAAFVESYLENNRQWFPKFLFFVPKLNSFQIAPQTALLILFSPKFALVVTFHL